MQQEILLHIEKLTKENFDNFIDLLSECRESKKTRHLIITMINRLKKDAFSTSPKYEVYLGKIGVEWVAYIIIVMSYSTYIALPCLLIDELFVRENFRSLGIGAAMLQFCVRKAKKKGCGKIVLTVPARNKKAKNFFEFNEAVPIDSTCYQMDLFEIKKGKRPGKMTYTDFIRKKRINKLSRVYFT